MNPPLLSRDACLDDPYLLAILVAANFIIFLAYMAIPIGLVWIGVRARQPPFQALGILFSGFIVSCGFTHLVAVLVFFRPAWHLEAAICVVTAVLSSITAVLLIHRRKLILAFLKDYEALANEMERLRCEKIGNSTAELSLPLTPPPAPEP